MQKKAEIESRIENKMAAGIKNSTESGFKSSSAAIVIAGFITGGQIKISKSRAVFWGLLLALLLTLTLASTAGPAAAAAAGAFTVTGSSTGYTYDSGTGVLTITAAGAYTIGNSDKATVTTDRIVINAGTAEAPVNLTLAGVNIEAADGPALDCGTNSVKLTLEGENICNTSHQDSAAVRVSPGGSLTIDKNSADSTDTLTAKNVHSDITNEFNGFGAGIGGSVDESCGNVILAGGTVTAESTYGAGIGGGGSDNAGGSGGTITINAGDVKASSVYGAGIGGGRSDNEIGGYGSAMTVNSGSITAISTYGAGIGGGACVKFNGGIGGSLTVTGGTVHASIRTVPQITGSLGFGAAIGGGGSNHSIRGGSGAAVWISGGSVTAQGNSYGMAIGGGTEGPSVTGDFNTNLIGTNNVLTVQPASGRQIAVRVGADASGSGAAALADSPFIYSTVQATGYDITDSINGQQYFNSEDSAAPTYTITAAPATIAFGSMAYGYAAAPEAKDVTLTNTGNQPVTLTVPSANDFNVAIKDSSLLDGEGKLTLQPTAQAVFTIQPELDLAADDYSEEIIFSAGSNVSAKVTATFTVSPAKVSISGVTVKDKIYDGSPAAVIYNSGTLSANYDGDNLTIDTAAAAAVFDNKNVGSNKTVAFSGFALGGSAAANYELQAQPESVKAAITACSLTVNVQVKDKQYDGTARAELTAAATLTGVVPGDDVQLAGGVPSFASSAVGEDIAVSFTEFTISGADAANYTLTQPTGITASITNDYNAVKGTDYTVNSNDWLKTDFVVTAREGYQLSLTNTDEGSWQSELKVADETANGTLAFYVRQVSTGAVSNKVSESYKIDKTVPVISGVTDRATYYTTQVAAVTDANPFTVTLNETDTASPVTLAGNTNIVYTIVVQDAAGNTASCQVTMKKIDSLAAPLDGLTVDNVKSSDQAAVEQLRSDVEKQLTDNAAAMTETERTALEELQTRATELLTEITETADEITRVNEAVADYNTNPNLNDAADKAAIEQLLSDIAAQLNGDNLTEAERTELIAAQAAAQELLNYYRADNSTSSDQYTVTTKEDIIINVTDDDAAIDDGLTLIMHVITDQNAAMNGIRESLQGIVEKNLLVLDIYFVDANGVKQPVSGNMTVTITLPAGYDADSIIICYIDEDGNVQELDCTVVNGQVTFTTDHNSIYVVGEKAAEYCNGQEKLSTLTDGTFELYLGGVYAGSFTFAQGADGWSIMDAEGNYLALQNGQLLYADEAFYWSYARDKFSAREQKSGSGWGWWNRFFNRTTTYYLSLQNGTLTVTTSSKAAQAEFYAASDSSTHQYGEWSANGDKTHSRTCSKCAVTETQACYDNDGDNLCDVCGTYLGEAYVDVSVQVTQKSSGWWWFSRTTYTAQISAAGHGVTIAQVQYSQDGSNWQKGSSFSSRKPIKSFYIEVTDSNGTVTDWQYADGVVQQLK